jgi:hypothetical protein
VDASRFPEGIIIQSDLTTVRPVNTIVRSDADGQLYVQTASPEGNTYEPLEGGGSASGSVILWVDTNVDPAPAVPDGSIGAPFPTIQEALDAAGVPIDVNDQLLVYAIMIAGGLYNEDITIPSYRSCNLFALGTVFLGDLATSTPRDVTIDVTGVPPQTGLTQEIGLLGQATEQFNIPGQILVTGDVDEGLELVLHEVKITGAASGGGSASAGIDASGWLPPTNSGRLGIETDRSSINGDSGNPSILGNIDVSLLDCTNTEFQGSVTAREYSHFAACAFEDDLTFLGPNVDLSGAAAGFFGCTFGGGTYEGTAGGIFVLDSTSYKNWIGAGGVLSNATYTRLDDAPGVEYTPTTPGDWNVQPTTVQEALDRIASILGPI